MKHVFVINPTAGKKNVYESIVEKLKEYQSDLDYEVYLTKEKNDAYQFVKNYLENYTDEVRIYSCGGDGTLNEVVNGVVGHPNASIACYACGSGNDFVKYFGKVDDFLDLESIIHGHEIVTDVIKVDDKYCLNICNFGLDAEVCLKMEKYKKLPLVSGPMAYNLGVIYCILFKMKYQINVKVDGELLYDGPALLCAVANGICYGGGYYCAPQAILDDGLLDVCLVKKISRFKASGLIKLYKKGLHLESPSLKDVVCYKRGKLIEFESKKPIAYCLDGEVSRTTKLKVEIVEKQIRFVVPKHIEKALNI